VRKQTNKNKIIRQNRLLQIWSVEIFWNYFVKKWCQKMCYYSKEIVQTFQDKKLRFHQIPKEALES